MRGGAKSTFGVLGFLYVTARRFAVRWHYAQASRCSDRRQRSLVYAVSDVLAGFAADGWPWSPDYKNRVASGFTRLSAKFDIGRGLCYICPHYN